MHPSGKIINGWQIKGWFDWAFTVASFVAFVCLEAALLYAYYTFLNDYLW